jgi:pilus assembly protein Flp/PilA
LLKILLAGAQRGHVTYTCTGNFPGTPNRRGKPVRQLSKLAVNFLKDEDGPTAVEYAVMLALIIVVCITAIGTLGSNSNKTFSRAGSAVNTAS